jgi:peptide/nickel transport system substrate-binding protein
MLVERRIGEYFRFEANPYFVGEPKPEFKSIKMVFRKEDTVRAAMVAKGEADVGFNLGPGAAALVTKITSTPATDVLMIRLDARFNPLLTDKRFRQALQYAINCQEMVKTIQQGFGQCTVVPAPPGSSGIPADLKLPYDPAKAKQFLKDAGKEGAPFTLVIRLAARFPFEAETYQAIVGYWKAIGLNVNLQVVESSSYTEMSRASAGQAPEVKVPPLAPLVTWSVPLSGEVLDTASMLAPYGTCRGARSLNCNAEMDDLFNKALAASGEERTRLTEQVVRKWYDEVPMISLFTLQYVAGMKANVDYTPTPDGCFVLGEIRRAK